MQYYIPPPRSFIGPVAVVRTATGEFMTITNPPPEDEAEPLEPHLAHINTPGFRGSSIFAGLPADQALIDAGAASRVSWDVSAPVPIFVPRAANNIRHAERAADHVTRNVLGLYGRKR
jgi:hypothetical protein